jgi:hypothetical protein
LEEFVIAFLEHAAEEDCRLVLLEQRTTSSLRRT